jgi:outer membrane murein-binding lipoprotein Lpp
MRNTLVAVALGLLVLAGCSSPTPIQVDDSAGRPTAAPTVSDLPGLDAEQKADYLAALEKIDPGLVVNEDRALTRAGRVCERMRGAGGGTMTLPEYVVVELSGGNATIDETQAKHVIEAVKVWCRP